MNHITGRKNEWYAVVNGHPYGPWPMREYAEAGLIVEQKRQQEKTMTTLYPEPTVDQLRAVLCRVHGTLLVLSKPEFCESDNANKFCAEAVAEIDAVMPWLKAADK